MGFLWFHWASTAKESKDSRDSAGGIQSLKAPGCSGHIPDPGAGRVRCAAYCRISVAENSEREFSSIDAQRAAVEAYIASQQSEGWIPVPESYEDNGFTGANADRPALQRLLADIEAGKIDVVVVAKIDRLSRSLLDFVRLLEIFEQHQVTFVSVSQHIVTSTSTGRLMLNVLMSFAQFEREIISETDLQLHVCGEEKRPLHGGATGLGVGLGQSEPSSRHQPRRSGPSP